MKTKSLPPLLLFLRQVPIWRKIGLLEVAFGKQLQEMGVVWVRTASGPYWKLDLRNPTHRWILFGNYEGPGFVPWARKWVDEQSVVVDSGANIGQVLLYLAPKIRTGKYIAVEPNPIARKWLLDCLARYPQWPVNVERFGLGAAPGKASLFGHEGEWAVGSHGSLRNGDGEIEVKTLDTYCAEKKNRKDRSLEAGYGGRGRRCDPRRQQPSEKKGYSGISGGNR
jgi:FkbM family methyltransferase